MFKEPRDPLIRYAFGYSNQKPSRSYWLVLAIMALYVLYQWVSIS